jgi:SAM-dependent methyltransferase
MVQFRSTFDVRRSPVSAIAAVLVIALSAGAAAAQQTQTQTQTQAPFEPQVGQAGKDVVWVPTDEKLVEKMLDIAKITPQDFVMDLGSGDGRNIIGAAKRGARAVGVEYNPQMVELSRANAKKAGVADKATFIEGDMYAADISKATALVLFLLPVNLEKLTPKFLDLKPGTRIVDNTFAIPGWEPDYTERLESDCQTWCSALLWIVPAKVDGTWRLPDGEITFEQKFQMVSGSVKNGSSSAKIDSGKLNGEEITFAAGGSQYTGKVLGDRIEGTVRTGSNMQQFTATRAK